MAKIDRVFEKAVEIKTSDLCIEVDNPPMFSQLGELKKTQPSHFPLLLPKHCSIKYSHLKYKRILNRILKIGIHHEKRSRLC
jgi:hypothetical protein